MWSHFEDLCNKEENGSHIITGNTFLISFSYYWEEALAIWVGLIGGGAERSLEIINCQV